MSGRGRGGGGRGRWRRGGQSKKVSFLEAVSMFFGINVSQMIYALFVVIAVTYLACSVCLVGLNSGWKTSAFVPVAPSSTFFSNSPLDCLFLSVILIIVVSAIARSATLPLPEAEAQPAFDPHSAVDVESCGCYKCYYYCCPTKTKQPSSSSEPSSTSTSTGASPWSSHAAMRSGDSSAYQPLLLAQHLQEDDSSKAEATINKPLPVPDAQDDMLDRKSRWDNRREQHLLCLFIISTAAQIYIAVKAIAFNFKDERTEGCLMGLGVLWVNMLVWTLREIVGMTKQDDAISLPQLHPHKLRLNLVVAGHSCDVCSLPCSEGRSFRCNLCDYDLCMRCYERAQKNDTSAMEGQIRSDKGLKVKEDEEVTMLGKGGYFGKCLDLVMSERRLFLVGMLFLLASNAASLLTPTVQGSILDAVVTQNRNKFHTWVNIYIVTAVTMGVVSGVKSMAFNIIGRRIATTLKLRLFSGMIKQDVAFFDGNHSGDLTSRLTQDVWFLVQPINSMFGVIVSNSVLLIGGIIMCFITSWRLSLLAFTTVGPIVFVTQSYAAWSQQINAEIYEAVGKANSTATEALSNIRTIKVKWRLPTGLYKYSYRGTPNNPSLFACPFTLRQASSTEEYEEGRFYDTSMIALKKGILDAYVGSGMNMINSYLDLFSTVLILWYGGILAMDGRDGMSPGKLITFQLYFNMINSSYNSLLDIVTSLTRSAGAAGRVFDLIDNMPDIDLNAGHGIPPGKLQGAIEFRGVSFAYQMRPDKVVLKNISLSIPAGTVCALVGQSGGGKSTLVSLMLRFYDPTTGTVLVDGKNLKDLCLRDVRRSMGVVQQSTDLFAGTIAENIRYGCSSSSSNASAADNEGSSKKRQTEEGDEEQEPEVTVTNEMVIEAAKKACAHDFIVSFPDGYETRIGERGIRISGGQKQRLSIARAFLRRPKILLLDEATSALDAESEAQVQQALDRLMTEGGATIVLVAHRLSTVINATQIAVIHEGAVVESGTHDELYAQKGAYFSLVQRQLKKKADVLEE